MRWNWELEDWPKFHYQEGTIDQQERQFLLGLGGSSAFLKTIETPDYKKFIVEVLVQEGQESSRIEGEFLDRESLQSSIKRQFGLASPARKIGRGEQGMAELLCDVYESYNEPLNHAMLWKWYGLLFHTTERAYRSHPEPMQIISNRYDRPRVFFEAPPSEQVYCEMERFITWFNTPHPSILAKAALAHVYFESIHPFEDGNGRIGRALIEKVLSQGINRPVLIAVSKILERRKKEYYEQLGFCNKTLSVTPWVAFMAEVILQAETDAARLLQFLVQKGRLLAALSGKLNPRQEKVLVRLFEEGPDGFKGGLSAEKYGAITKASRATITRDLSELVELGALTKTGLLRHTRYWLNFLLPQ